MDNYKEFDSDEEKYFSWYLDELIRAGYIKKAIYQPKAKLLSNSVYIKAEKKLKSKTNIVDFHLLREKRYTPDWLIEWNDCAHDVFYERITYLVPSKS